MFLVTTNFRKLLRFRDFVHLFREHVRTFALHTRQIFANLVQIFELCFITAFTR